MEKRYRSKLVFRRNFITGIGQGYIQSSPLQLCLMTAQLANGGYKIYPKIVEDENQLSVDQIKNKMLEAAQNLNLDNEKNSIVKATEEFLKTKTKNILHFMESRKCEVCFRCNV